MHGKKAKNLEIRENEILKNMVTIFLKSCKSEKNKKLKSHF